MPNIINSNYSPTVKTLLFNNAELTDELIMMSLLAVCQITHRQTKALLQLGRKLCHSDLWPSAAERLGEMKDRRQ